MDAVRVLLRRWYIVLAGLVVIAGAAVSVIRVVPTQYQASGQLLLLLPSQATGARTPTNPYLNLQIGLVTTASIISSSMMTPDTQRQLKEKGYTADYSVDVLPDSGPVVVVTAKSSNGAEAMKTRDGVIQALGAKLASMQSAVNVPENQTITPQPANVDTAPQVLPGSKIRAVAAVAATGVVTTLVVVFVVDGRRSKGRSPRTRRPPGKVGSGENGPDDERQGEPVNAAARVATTPERASPSEPRPPRRPRGKGRADNVRSRPAGPNAAPAQPKVRQREGQPDSARAVTTPKTSRRTGADARDT